MNSKFLISWYHVVVMTGAGLIALIAQKWVAAAAILALALVAGLFTMFTERWDRSRRGH